MASSPDLLLGLVTHERSRYRESGELTLQAVADAAREAGIQCEILISDRNDADISKYRIDRSTIRRSALHQAALEARWRRHLDHLWGGAAGDLLLTGAMAVRRSLASPDTIIRLLNIDLSHLRIWRTALARGAPAALVLEDDAELRNDEIGAVIAGLLNYVAQQTVLVNCSASIELSALGADGILRDAPTTALDPGHMLVRPTRALTNTVCANLYSAEALRVLVSFIDYRGLVPVAPIDWRVNECLLENPQIHTWWLDPPPFQQGSMHV